MIIKNYDSLTQSTHGEAVRIVRAHVLEAIDAAIRSVMPENLLSTKMRVEGHTLRVLGDEFDLDVFSEVYVIGGGKASVGMVTQLDKLLGDRISGGEVAAKVAEEFKIGAVRVNPASHPLPDERSAEATERIFGLVSKATPQTLYIVVISGGASAMLASPRDGLSIRDKAETTRLLLECGANIEEINTVRKHLSKVKGGQLQRLIYPATSITLMLSDVVGDKLDVIGSGPTQPDPTSFLDAYRILEKYGLLNSVPSSVLSFVKRGVGGLEEETPKPGSMVFKTAHNYVIGSNSDACTAAWRTLKERGYTPLLLTTRMQGEAREVGRFLAGMGISQSNPPFDAYVLGGETTVTLRGKGVGGRNQELCLASLIAIKGWGDIVLASVGTDGVDGVSEAAGGIVDGYSYSDALAKGVSPEEYLGNNDSGTFFKKVGGAIITGPTGTNVSDLVLLVRRG
ncbi:MAG: glycerate kinase [Thermoprotei archaeon]